MEQQKWMRVITVQVEVFRMTHLKLIIVVIKTGFGPLVAQKLSGFYEQSKQKYRECFLPNLKTCKSVSNAFTTMSTPDYNYSIF